ncbi:MAG: hypothetical protein M1561_02310 [Gammaproteobacteria bacterium]|nr:hypothetical protein [Gammaproteobacteria bacterium]
MQIKKQLLIVIALCFLPIAAAQADISGYGFDDMLVALQENAPQVIKFVIATSYVMGVWFIFSAVLALKIYGQQRTMMPLSFTFTGPVMKLVIGLALLYLPTVLDIAVWSIWQHSIYNVLNVNPGQSDYTSVIKSAVILVRVVGYFSVMRGFVMLSRNATGSTSGHQPGIVGKSFMYIIGGIFCINVVETVRMIEITFGYKPNW